MYELKITLKSDLCAADGDGRAAAIDTDICTDINGLPVIPARRIKGCLKEAAALIGTSSESVSAIFGTIGSSKGCPLHISDAVLVNADRLADEAASQRVSPAVLTDLYTYVRASTAINNETDTAKNKSLRFVRVVKHFDPISGKELEFRAAVSIPEEYSQELSRICRALRNIGFKRSRGFGAVRCELIKSDEKRTEIPVYSFADDKEYVIRYSVKLTDDVMISGSTSDETIDYLPGTSVLGFFANEYLKSHTTDDEFEEIFLKNGVVFSNLYISDKAGREYLPAPVILGKIKGEKRPVNMIEKDKPENDRLIMKPLKSCYTDSDLNIKSPLTETVYHIDTKKEDGLYMQTALRKGQYFRGTISGRGRYLGGIYEIMKGGVIRVGRSKTAQYSSCKILPEQFAVAPKGSGTISVKSGEVFIAALTSHMLISDKMGGYVSDMGMLVDLIADSFGFDCREADKGMKLKRSALKYSNIHGYNTQWNLKKPHIRAIAAGSAIAFTADKDYTLSECLQLGEKQGEGFGFVKIMKSSDLIYRERPAEAAPDREIGESAFTAALEQDKMRAAALDYAAAQFQKCKTNGSQLGRAILMAKQADNYDDFKQRVTCLDESLQKYLSTDLFIIYEKNWREFAVLILTLAKYQVRTAKEENA